MTTIHQISNTDLEVSFRNILQGTSLLHRFQTKSDRDHHHAITAPVPHCACVEIKMRHSTSLMVLRGLIYFLTQDFRLARVLGFEFLESKHHRTI